jgi:hypothetical protein
MSDEVELPRYRAIERVQVKAAGFGAAVTLEPDEEFSFEGTPGIGMLPLNAAARIAKLKSLSRYWARDANLGHIHRLARSFGFAGDPGEARAFLEQIETEARALSDSRFNEPEFPQTI